MAKTTKKTAFKKNVIAKDLVLILGCAGIMVAGGFLARAIKPADSAAGGGDGKIATTPITQHEAIKAEVLDDDPSHFMIDVEKFANLGADDNAKTFAVYVSDDKPKTCGDFTELELPYEKPEEHKRLFDLSDHPEILEAIEEYGCVAMRNIPPTAAG